MSFLTPWAFWIAAAVIPALLILYFLKLRRREEWISSTFLWKRAVQDLQVNAPFQRLRRNLLLFLQLLILALAILALARPIVESTAPQEGRLVIMIDRSASMNTVEPDGRTRLEHAKEQAERLVRTLNRRSRDWLSFLSFGGAAAETKAMVIALADRATVLSPFTANATDLIDIIRNIKPTDQQTHLREALDLAEAYMAPPTMITDATPVSAEDPAKVVLFSDGAIADVGDTVFREGQVELVTIGAAQNNVGITAFRAQRNYERPEVVHAFLQLENFSPGAVTTQVSVYVEGQLADARVRSVTLGPAVDRTAQVGTDLDNDGPAAMQGLSFEITLERAAVIEARVARTDALLVDNSAFVAVPPPRRLRVLVVTENNFFLDSVLEGLPLAERVFVTPGQYTAGRGGPYVAEGRSTFDVVLFDKFSPEELPVGNYLFFGATPPVSGVEFTDKVQEAHPLVWWDETHPILRHVALDYVFIGDDHTLALPEDAEVLMEGPQGPSLARIFADGRHYLVLSFAVENSNWWQKPSFPVFAYNALRYLGAGGAAAESGTTRPGDTLRLALPEAVEQAVVEPPRGGPITVKPDATGMVYFGGTDDAGLYRVRYAVDGEEVTDVYAVNLEDPRESDVAPRGANELARPEIIAGQAIETSTPEVWRWFIGIALGLVLLEWWIYNRRVMI